MPAVALSQAQLRWLEMFAIFLLLPLLAWPFRQQLQLWLIPVLLLLALYCYGMISRDASFKRFRLLNAAQVAPLLRRRLPVFVLGGLLGLLIYSLLGDGRWFVLPTESPQSWLLLLLCYPLLSAWPQELIFRTFFFHRYKKIIPRKKHRMLLSALLFGYAHLVYANLMAVLLALLGGFLFAYTYAKTRSTLACVVEHSIWGLWLFTLGLGQYLDSGAST